MEVLAMRKFLFLAVFILAATNLQSDAPPEWKQLAPGLDLAIFKARHPATLGDSKITVLRIDPNSWNLEFAGLSQNGGDRNGYTARGWCAKNNFTAAINAGMFQEGDGRTHVGYLRSGDHVNSRRITSYQSVTAFGPRTAGKPRFHMFDLQKPAIEIPTIAQDYMLVAQNLRLVQRPGIDKWRPQKKKASETALGEDEAGRILFIFARSPFSMYELNEELLHANISLVAAQYLEGGPEAQLYLHTGNTEMEMFGSFETSFIENNSNDESWPIPNVLAIRPRGTPSH